MIFLKKVWNKNCLKNGFPLMNSLLAQGTISFLTTLYRVVIIMVVLK